MMDVYCFSYLCRYWSLECGVSLYSMFLWYNENRVCILVSDFFKNKIYVGRVFSLWLSVVMVVVALPFWPPFLLTLSWWNCDIRDVVHKPAHFDEFC